MSDFNQEATKLEPSALVSLYQLDTTKVGGPVYHFTTETRLGSTISFDGVEYYAVPIRITGMNVSGQGPIQTPTMSIGNTDGFIQQVVNAYGNIEGCKLVRYRTFAKHLDGFEDPNPDAIYGPDVYLVDRKATDTPEVIEWELSAVIDQQGVYVGRTVVRDTCLFRYREFNPVTGTFDYSKAICPYAGAAFFDIQNNPVTLPQDDAPARNLNCCRVRFGANNPLPFGGFTGVVRGL